MSAVTLEQLQGLLVFAIREGDTGAVRELLRRGVDPDKAWTRRTLSRVPLVEAALQGAEMLRLLLDYGANPDTPDAGFGDTALHKAVSFNTAPRDVESVALLLARGADQTLANKAGQTPQAVAALRQGAVTAALLQDPPPREDVPLSLPDTAADAPLPPLPGLLRAAVAAGDLAAARALLEAGADPNDTGRSGNAALHEALSVEMIDLLLDRGAKIDAVNAEGNTLLLTLVLREQQAREFRAGGNTGLPALVRRLVERGCALDAVSGQGRTAAEMARGWGLAEMGNLFRRAQDERQRQAVQRAAQARTVRANKFAALRPAGLL